MTTGRFPTGQFWPFTCISVVKDKVNKWEFRKLKITPIVVFVIMIQPIFPSWALVPMLCLTEDSGKITSTENNTSLQMKNIHSLWPALLNCIWTWVTPPKRVTLPTWSPPPPCKQALNLHVQLQLGGPLWLHLTDYSLFNMMYEL